MRGDMMAVPIFAAFVLGALLVAPDLPVGGAVAAALPGFLALVPLIFRYSRILWMHIDQVLLSQD